MRTTTVVLVFLAAMLGCRQESKGPSADDAIRKARAYAQAEVAIERMRKQETPDWAGIREQYEITLPLVKAIDGNVSTTYEKEIGAALDKCAAGERVKVNQQVLAKGLQHVTVLIIRGMLGALAGMDQGSELSKTQAEAMAAFFEGIRPTFARRDTDFFADKPVLEPAADKALTALKEACAQGTDVLTPTRELNDMIDRTYALCVLYEIQGVENLRDTDRAKCDVKKMEAVVFYRIITDKVKRNAPEAHDAIVKMLDADYGKMNAEELERNLKLGLKMGIGK